MEQLEQGNQVKISGESYTAENGDFIVINRGIRHDLGNKAFLTRFIDNKYCEINTSEKYYPENDFDWDNTRQNRWISW